jgi:iron(III) transport system substrate-binding protein
MSTVVALFASLVFLLTLVSTHAAAANSGLLKAKQEAEASGRLFFTTHEEIVAMAKKEGKLRVVTGLEPQNFKPLIDGFKEKFPFISDVQVDEIHGSTEAYQRFLMEIRSGQAKQWDITFTHLDFVADYIPHLKKHDIMGMAKHGVLNIDPRMIHPVERNIVSFTSVLTVVPYNRKLIADDKVPASWEDFLKPEFKGKKFVLDIRPLQVAGLVPAWGLERTLDFARKLRAQEPVWGRGATRMTTAVAAGEYPLYIGSNFGSIHRAMNKDTTGSLSYKIIEPAPARVVDQINGILNTAAHPHAALLWFEFLTSPEGQKIIDKYEPLKASVFSPSSAVAQATRGKELSVIDWDHTEKFHEYEKKITEAFGFPKAAK